MSEYFQKKDILKGLIKDLHAGRDFDEVKREFGQLIKDIDASEIAALEKQLMDEGMDPEEIKEMCDVHAALFKDALLENEQPQLIPGHPLHSIKFENEQARNLLEEMENEIKELPKDNEKASNRLTSLTDKANYFKIHLDKHFSKKENVFFPYLEKHNITGPPSVMWSVDDEIRAMVKELNTLLRSIDQSNFAQMQEKLQESFDKAKTKTLDMFFKEEEILSPMMKNTLTEQEWAEIKDHSREFGIIFAQQEQDLWQPENIPQKKEIYDDQNKLLNLDTGRLTPKQINSILTSLPIDITFVDENDEVAYFSQSLERIFTRTKSIIGRKVQNCHPPDSVHMVEKIIEDFKSGKQSSAHFWLELDGKFIHIRYLAIRDESGRYVGTVEVSQDLTQLRSLEGERRLLSYQE